MKRGVRGGRNDNIVCRAFLVTYIIPLSSLPPLSHLPSLSQQNTQKKQKSPQTWRSKARQLWSHFSSSQGSSHEPQTNFRHYFFAMRMRAKLCIEMCKRFTWLSRPCCRSARPALCRCSPSAGQARPHSFCGSWIFGCLGGWRLQLIPTPGVRRLLTCHLGDGRACWPWSCGSPGLACCFRQSVWRGRVPFCPMQKCSQSHRNWYKIRVPPRSCARVQRCFCANIGPARAQHEVSGLRNHAPAGHKCLAAYTFFCCCHSCWYAILITTFSLVVVFNVPKITKLLTKWLL